MKANRFNFRAWDGMFMEYNCYPCGDGAVCSSDQETIIEASGKPGGVKDSDSTCRMGKPMGISRWFCMIWDNKPVLMQSTGLTDSTGKEIFEGDVVRQIDYCGCVDTDDDIPHTWVVMTDEGNTGFHPFTSCYSDQGSVRCIERDCCCYATPEEMEVIGNIYENPELVGK